MSSSETENRHKPDHINPPVFFISAELIFVLVTFSAFFPEQADVPADALQSALSANAS
ncbi:MULTISPECIES: hypothetical protein [Pantoea]|uniref:hypothetical protein n=1 Tax=Pantoea TaxID=53335 RepID=UPI00130368FE|nr:MULTISPECIES: hypothetical protein [Pantoea]MBN1090561.1 hypothetical protein [Pantoea sp. 1B4]